MTELKFTDYYIASGGYYDVITEVNNLLSEGYVPFGGISHKDNTYFQSPAKPVDNRVEVSERKVIEFTVIKETSRISFVNEVISHLNSGWTLEGGSGIAAYESGDSYGNSIYTQNMVKYDEPKDKPKLEVSINNSALIELLSK